MSTNIQQLRRTFIILTIAIPLLQKLQAQNLFLVKDPKLYSLYAASDSNYRMVELHAVIPGIIYDLRYATSNNFTHKRLYPRGNKTYLRLPAANALLKVQQELNFKGYGLKIFDAYRPYRVTKKMWDLIKDERYVANPVNGSGHNRGIAVDLTVIELKTGKELDMGTGFDNFSDTAHISFRNLPGPVLQNRELLKQTMEKYGFKVLETEWWHYSWPNNRNYDVMDLSFKKLRDKRGKGGKRGGT